MRNSRKIMIRSKPREKVDYLVLIPPTISPHRRHNAWESPAHRKHNLHIVSITIQHFQTHSGPGGNDGGINRDGRYNGDGDFNADNYGDRKF